jgi:ribonuclease P protein component
VLPAQHRMRAGTDFEEAVRRGRRAGSPRLVVHLARRDRLGHDGSASGVRVGFVVSRAVGGSVVRHRVARRLRAVLAEHLTSLPPDALVVVRAAPPAASATSAQLGADVERLLRRLGLLTTSDGAR